MSVINPIDKATAKRALSSYIKGLLQDYINETGDYIESLPITYTMQDNKRIVKEVEVVTAPELPEF